MKPRFAGFALIGLAFFSLSHAAPVPGVIDYIQIEKTREDSSIQYRPKMGSVGDTIPFYWKGQYHIFYLRAGFEHQPWDHIVSTDLIHWHELPTALVPDGDAKGPDGQTMGTGSIFEHKGVFHAFYTGDNFRNPKGTQSVMHATSSDLVNWTKHPEDVLYADGVHYGNQGFRDPYIMWNEEAKKFWMIICAFDIKTGKPLQGLAESDDLVTWKEQPPLIYDPVPDANSECPDLFQIGGTWYMVHSMWYPATETGATFVRFAKKPNGPYTFSPTKEMDTTIFYAAKSMFDGKRRVITGWIRDLGAPGARKDDGKEQFGGDQCIPREIYEGPSGQLYFRPVVEATAHYAHLLLSSAKDPRLVKLTTPIPTPHNYMLECTAKIEPGADFTVAMRQTGTDMDSGYRLVIHSAKQEAEIASSKFSYTRKINIDFSKPVKIQAFVQGTMIESFINDAYPFSCRAYEHPSGDLELSATHGTAQVLDLATKTDGAPQSESPTGK